MVRVHGGQPNFSSVNGSVPADVGDHPTTSSQASGVGIATGRLSPLCEPITEFNAVLGTGDGNPRLPLSLRPLRMPTLTGVPTSHASTT